jgi:hypothetical protein
MCRRLAPPGLRPGRIALPAILALLLAATLASIPGVSLADPEGGYTTFGPSTGPPPAENEFARVHADGASPANLESPLSPLTTGFVPIPNMPTEDVDVVEVLSPGMGPLLVWPTEGAVHFFASMPGPIGPPIASLPTVSPNISGVDFVSNGSYGAFVSLGFLYLYDLTGPVPVLSATIALPGTPGRRDVDPVLISHPLSITTVAVLVTTGTEISCYSVPAGGLIWSTPLPSPVVEAVDPVVNAASTLIFVPHATGITAINAVTGAPLTTTVTGTPVREIDARFVLGDTRCYFPATGGIWVLDGTPPGGGGIGALLAFIPTPGLFIEGNDLESDPSGFFGWIPTLPAMLKVNYLAMALAGTFPFVPGAVHQRNHDTVFSDPSAGPVKALYCTQGTAWQWDQTTMALEAAYPIPGTLVDGVDPAFTDSPPFGSVALVPTMGFTHIISVFALSVNTLATPGVLRTDVDARPGPMPGNKLVLPVIGGLLWADGFSPTEWTVTVSNGFWVVDPAVLAVVGFVPSPGLVFRGGDAQATTLLGPPEPAFSIDNPDQDFLTKCWEYKYAMNRWPYWWYYSQPAYYPHWVPFGVFGPPALVGYDMMNDFKVCLLGPLGVFPNQVAILNQHGSIIQIIPVPVPVLSGIIWDWDNKICKLRLQGQQEMIINLGPLAWSASATYVIAPLGFYARWYPVVDRMNGWEFMAQQGLRQLTVYDHINNVFGPTITLPAMMTRRPMFDEQRKTLCVPLASRQVCFINSHRLRLGLPNAVMYSPVLPAHVVGQPVFDIYNHYTVCKLYGGRLCVLDNDDASLVWDSGILPYWPVGPMQIDCYNKIGKGFFRDAALTYYEMWVNFYPLVFGGVPTVQWLSVPGVPYGYPVFDSKDGYEFYRTTTNLIQYSYLFNPLIASFIPTPFPMVGNLFFDRINKYGLVRLSGARLFWMDLHKVTSGIPGATHVIPLPVAAEDDIVFDTQGHYAAVHLSDQRVALVDMVSGALTYISAGLPPLQRQLYVHPFRELVNWPFKFPPSGPGGEVTLDLSPLRFSPPSSPFVNIANTPSIPLEADDFSPPPPIVPIEIVQLSLQSGDIGGVVHFRLTPLATDPGNMIQATNVTTFDLPEMDEPNEAVQDESGSEISVMASAGDQVCFVAFDMAGNASPQVCVPVAPVTGVTPGANPTRFTFALASASPARASARFHFALPERAEVDLALYDISGRRVVQLARGVRPAGEYDEEWHLTGDDGHPVATGVYFASIRSGANQASVRVAVIR